MNYDVFPRVKYMHFPSEHLKSRTERTIARPNSLSTVDSIMRCQPKMYVKSFQ